MLKRLVRDGFSPDVAERAVKRAVRCGLISDARYAEVLVSSRVAQGRGMDGIARELRQAGINPDMVPAYRMHHQNKDGQNELTRALDVLEAKPPKSKRLREAAFRKLVQKGYSTDTASRAARIFCEKKGQTAPFDIC